MEFTDVLTLIGNYAFPIVASIALFWQLNKNNQLHREETKELQKAIDNNTKALLQMAAKLGTEVHLDA